MSEYVDKDLNAVVSEPLSRVGVQYSGLSKPQKIHATLILVAPIFGAFLAIDLALKEGIGWVELSTLLFMYSVSWVGITVGYHRYFSHKSFKARLPVHIGLGIMGSMACQGPVNYWVSNHRRHHQYSDLPGDIHSPYIKPGKKIGGLVGFFHSHIGWTFTHEISDPGVVAKDLLRDRWAARIHRQYYFWLAIGFVLPAAFGGLATLSLMGALKGLLWGGMVRLLLCYHSTNTITSLTHMWGGRTYKTTDQSRNNFWLSLPTWGEAWHNNHHAFPYSAIFGHRWYQIDLGGMLIRTLAAVGLVYDLRRPRLIMMSEKLIARAN